MNNRLKFEIEVSEHDPVFRIVMDFTQPEDISTLDEIIDRFKKMIMIGTSYSEQTVAEYFHQFEEPLKEE